MIKLSSYFNILDSLINLDNPTLSKMKDFQKIAFGGVVTFLAFGFSVFTPAKNKVLNTFIVQTSDGTFQQYTSTDPIDLGNCDPGTDHKCIYRVTIAGQIGITTSGPWCDADIDAFLTKSPLPYIIPFGPMNAIFVP